MIQDALLHALTRPEQLAETSLEEWDRLLPRVRHLRMLGWLHERLAMLEMIGRVPDPVRAHLEAAAVTAQVQSRKIHWEVNRIRRALLGTDIPVVLLKGAAYEMAGLPCAAGRLSADVDLLVPETRLGGVEKALRAHGWLPVKLDDYDQQYYRRWMHELPPMRHRMRGTEVDIHHTILPLTSRLKPDPAALLAAARPTREPAIYVLCPADMVLHSATHAFYDGDLGKGLRDLMDLHELLAHFGAEPGFWEELPGRARRMDLERPLFYALRYARRLLNTPVPEPVSAALDKAGPGRPLRWLMDRLMIRTLLAGPEPGPVEALAGWLLYVRSHWLRMPPLLLTRHLLRKALRRARPGPATNQTGA